MYEIELLQQCNSLYRTTQCSNKCKIKETKNSMSIAIWISCSIRKWSIVNDVMNIYEEMKRNMRITIQWRKREEHKWIWDEKITCAACVAFIKFNKRYWPNATIVDEILNEWWSSRWWFWFGIWRWWQWRLTFYSNSRVCLLFYYDCKGFNIIFVATTS